METNKTIPAGLYSQRIIAEDIKTPKLVGETYMKYATTNSSQRNRFGIYECPYCGREFESAVRYIKNGTKSCGCFNANRTHGLTSHRFYKTWLNMLDRCYNKNFKRFNDYGGRGITVCTEWLDIKNFVDWVDNKSNWEEGLTLDRIDNDKGYSPDNCTFSTKTIQSINQRQQSNNTSGYVGVTWDKRRNKWSARVHIFKRGKHIGYYLNKEEAVQARDKYILENNLPHKLSTEYVKEIK